MATEAAIGYGTTIEVETAAGSDTFTELGEITSVTPPEDTVDQIDVTHMGSPGRRREYISGLIDGGEGSFDLNWVPGAATHDFIVAWQAAGDTRDLRITYPNNARETFPAFPTGFSRTAPVDDKMTGTLTVKQAGETTWDTAS